MQTISSARPALPALLALVTSLVACGGDAATPAEPYTEFDDATPQLEVPVSLTYEERPFKGMSYDTGWRPANAKVQVRFFVTAQTMMRASVEGTAGLLYDQLGYHGTQDGGEFEMDIGFEIKALMKIDTASIQWEGEIGVIPQYDLRFADAERFTPFVLQGDEDRPVHLVDDIDKQKLFSAPVPGLNIPGIGGGSFQLRAAGTLEADLSGLEIETVPEQGSPVVITRAGQRAGWSGGDTARVNYRARVVYSGVVTFYPTVAIDIPLGQDLNLVDIPIPVDLDRLGNLEHTWDFEPATVTFAR